MSDIINNENSFSYKEATLNSNYETYKDTGYIPNDSSFLFAVSRNDNLEIIHGSLTPSAESIFHILKDNSIKEKFYITAIKNLIKQKKYINLIYELTNELIDEDEFNKELSENEEQYLINVNHNLDSLEKIRNLVEVLQNIDEEFHEEDLMEIFSLSDSFIIKNLTITTNKRK